MVTELEKLIEEEIINSKKYKINCEIKEEYSFTINAFNKFFKKPIYELYKKEEVEDQDLIQYLIEFNTIYKTSKTIEFKELKQILLNENLYKSKFENITIRLIIYEILIYKNEREFTENINYDYFKSIIDVINDDNNICESNKLVLLNMIKIELEFFRLECSNQKLLYFNNMTKFLENEKIIKEKLIFRQKKEKMLLDSNIYIIDSNINSISNYLNNIIYKINK